MSIKEWGKITGSLLSRQLLCVFCNFWVTSGNVSHLKHTILMIMVNYFVITELIGCACHFEVSLKGITLTGLYL